MGKGFHAFQHQQHNIEKNQYKKAGVKYFTSRCAALENGDIQPIPEAALVFGSVLILQYIVLIGYNAEQRHESI